MFFKENIWKTTAPELNYTSQAKITRGKNTPKYQELFLWFMGSWLFFFLLLFYNFLFFRMSILYMIILKQLKNTKHIKDKENFKGKDIKRRLFPG